MVEKSQSAIIILREKEENKISNWKMDCRYVGLISNKKTLKSQGKCILALYLQLRFNFLLF